MVGPYVLLTPLASGPLWFSAKVACPALLLRQPSPASRLCPSSLRPPLTGAAPACTGNGQPAQPSGPQPPLPRASCLQSSPSWAGASGQPSFVGRLPPQPSGPGLLGPGQGCPGLLRPWPEGGQAPSKAGQGLAGTQPPALTPRSVSLGTGKALLRKSTCDYLTT